MDPNKSAGAPQSDWSGEKSTMGQAAPPPYHDNPAPWYPQAEPGVQPPQQMAYGAPQPQYGGPGYGPQQYQGQPAVIIQPTQYVVPVPLENPVNDYLCYSIFTMLCCCLPLGVAALIYSISAREANHAGNRMAAERSSKTARTLNHVGLGIGIAFLILWSVYLFAREANFVGDRMKAERSSRLARTYNHVSLGIGLGFILGFVIYIVVLLSVRDANQNGDRMKAERNSRTAKTLNQVALGIGLSSIILFTVYMLVVAVVFIRA